MLDLDVRGLFDAMSHEWTVRFLRHRIGDKRLLRLIVKWLKVGVMEDGRVVRSERGTPQGSVISPTLANVYLHYVFDLWVHAWRRKKATGDMTVIRYADDAVLGFEHEHEARAFLQQLQERLATFDLELHPDKTRIIEFGRHARAQRKARGERKPETFDFLGFTHFCTYSRKYGSFVIGRKTIKKRLRARLQFLKVALRRRMHAPIARTGAWLHRVLQGHLNYFSVSGNDRILWAFFQQVRWYWLRTLRRRSQRGYFNWDQFVRRTARFFPKIRVMHPYPLVRFDARTQGRSPVR